MWGSKNITIVDIVVRQPFEKQPFLRMPHSQSKGSNFDVQRHYTRACSQHAATVHCHYSLPYVKDKKKKETLKAVGRFPLFFGLIPPNFWDRTSSIVNVILFRNTVKRPMVKVKGPKNTKHFATTERQSGLHTLKGQAWEGLCVGK